MNDIAEKYRAFFLGFLSTDVYVTGNAAYVSLLSYLLSARLASPSSSYSM